ncbi:MAG TPA: phosphoribosylanthranilate isomerase, partial [Acidimicrobiales bacterium]
GSGLVFDWGLAEGRPDGMRLIMAGGLTPANVADAIDAVRPWGVDVATGVETEGGAPGQKDAMKVKAFIDNAKAAAPVGHESDFVAPFDWEDELS